jgi:prepilin-type processing-associated H-X9-DG protein
VAIIVTCECGQSFETRNQNAGRRAKCPVCGRVLVVPKPDSPGDPDDLVHLELLPAYTSGKAIASLVLGLMSFFLCFVSGLPAIILGILGLNEIGQSKGRIKGQGMATAGIVFGAIGCTAVFLIALLLPAVQAAREAARRSQCINNLKQIALAMHNYHATWDAFPPQAITDANGKPLLSWRVAILPYIEQEPLYRQFHLDEPWDSPTNKALLGSIPATYRCPTDPGRGGPGMTAYEGVVGPHTMFPGAKGVRLQNVTDGTSNTILVGEAATPVPWTAPDDIPIDTPAPIQGFGSFHAGGFNAAFADGSIKFIKISVNPAVLRALLTRDGGEVVSNDSY